MEENEKIALVNVKPSTAAGCGAPVSELYRQMSRQNPKVRINGIIFLKLSESGYLFQYFEGFRGEKLLTYQYYRFRHYWQ